jgi:hypothetical protein
MTAAPGPAVTLTAHPMATVTRYIGITSAPGSSAWTGLEALATVIAAFGTFALGVAAVLALRKRQDPTSK